MKIGLISDTHSYIDERIISYLQSCDEIWHAGDIGDLKVTDELSKITKTRAVYGNIDDQLARREFPKNEVFEIEGFKVFMTHIGGKPGRYYAGIREQINRVNPDIFICGHSHICKVVMDKSLNCLYMNPGAAGIHGFHHIRTLLRFDLLKGEIKNLEVVELGKRGKGNS